MPRFQHDCEHCVCLGEFRAPEEPPGDFDLYFCGQGFGHPTVIARFGDRGQDYQSGLEAGKSGLLPSLAEAYRRAKEQKLVD